MRRASLRELPCLLRQDCLPTARRHNLTKSCHGTIRHVSNATFTSRVPLQHQARVAANEVTAGELGDEEVSFSEGLRDGISKALAKHREAAKSRPMLSDYPPPGSNLYGKWQSLSLDYERLLSETDVNVSSSDSQKLVDQPENANDLELWSCLLHFLHRRMGGDGVVLLWQAVVKRRNMYQVEGPLANAFWGLILKTAVSNPIFLGQVFEYANWMFATHQVRWPAMYSTIICYMLEYAYKDDLLRWQILRWHLLLMPSFGPDEATFSDVMRQFITSPNRHVQESLEFLYSFNTHRKLYDIFVPFLYDRGQVSLAMRWRKTFCSFKDTPMSSAARPMLRYLAAYYPRTTFDESELRVADLAVDHSHNEITDIRPRETAITGQSLSYLINRVHGETFGIKEKTYNDKMGAKWFASSWVGLDFAINVVYMMGMKGIGPQSVQSIALREGTAEGVLRRMDQLQQLDISLPDTTYVRAIRHYATSGDNTSLMELLHSDIHPDIYDNEQASEEVLATCIQTGDWNTYRLILRTRIAVMSSYAAEAHDSTLEACIRRGNGSMALQLLKEMAAHRISVSPTTSHLLQSFILHELSRHASPKVAKAHVDIRLQLSRQLAMTRFPPAVEVWQTLLYRLGREKRLADLEELSLFIVQLFADHAASDQPMWISHMADVPELLHSESPFTHFQKLPRELPLLHEKHPLRQIFDDRMQSSMVRWGFMYTQYGPRAEAAAAVTVVAPHPIPNRPLYSMSSMTPRDQARHPALFHFARGIRLLAVLRDRGLFIGVANVQKQATLRLVDLYRGGGRPEYEWVSGNARLSQLRRLTRFNLNEAKTLCEEAWEGERPILDLVKLNQAINAAEHKDLSLALQRMDVPFRRKR
ncbi:hypothetical protein BD289DRAFT_422039 [Coniella lustricola]|uniref:Pentatricopeptide repeat domain-containing protein n=1 Tax=Coniella lustricola TaxID=2025994 RepID=A0A2T3AL96_9PEZI|nr:hypothetical protein BD289DRAFT_422039 [Coniella lustricola]